MRTLERYKLLSLTFDQGELYLAKLARVLTSSDLACWEPTAFGLAPSWAREATIMRSKYNPRTEMVAERASFTRSTTMQGLQGWY